MVVRRFVYKTPQFYAHILTTYINLHRPFRQLILRQFASMSQKSMGVYMEVNILGCLYGGGQPRVHELAHFVDI